jgi:hypothetical protein
LTSAFTLMLEAVASRPSMFTGDQMCRTAQYSKFLTSAAGRRTAGTPDEDAAWRRFRDGEGSPQVARDHRGEVRRANRPRKASVKRSDA